MKKVFKLITFALAIAASHLAAQVADEPPRIIFDTDMGGDCDDVGALFMLHGAIERREAHLLATMGCTSSEAIVPCIDAINTWFGRPEIPVGTLKDAGFLPSVGYPGELIKHFPHRFPTSAAYPDAVVLYRQILAREPDHSVRVVAVGPLRNLANLLKSAADDISPLDGTALVAKKVKQLDVMGGNYPSRSSGKDAEWNFKQDPAAAAFVCKVWPTPILFNGEGGSTNSGRRVTYEMPEHNPLTMAYANYPGTGFAGDRLSWDPISCLVAVRGAAPWYEIVSGGSNSVDPITGVNTWLPGQGQAHSYLVLKAAKPIIEVALEDLMVAGRGQPRDLNFDSAYYARDGMCQISSQGAADASTAAAKAFDRDDQSTWLDKADTSWIQCQSVDGRKSLVTSYTLLCPQVERQPRTLELAGSNDDGRTWILLDRQEAPGFTKQLTLREFTIAKPAKWNIYRLRVAAADDSEGVCIATLKLNQSIRCLRDIAISRVTLDNSTLEVSVHGRATLHATSLPADSFARQVTWASSDLSVVTVRSIGEQTGMIVGKKPGTSTVTASIGEVVSTCEVTVTPTSLPAEWSYHEMGAPPLPGAVSAQNGRFTLTGCGHSMTSWWQRVKDQGVFVSRSLAGAEEISACLTSLGPNVGGPAFQWDHRPPTAAGLMIRESLSEASSRYFIVQAEASGNLVCRWRDKSGDVDDNQRKELGKITLPLYLRITCNNEKVQIYSSQNGTAWGDPLWSHQALFRPQSRLGMFVCSGNTFASSTAVFDSVRTAK